MYLSIYVSICIYMYLYVSMYLCIYVSMYLCTYVCNRNNNAKLKLRTAEALSKRKKRNGNGKPNATVVNLPYFTILIHLGVLQTISPKWSLWFWLIISLVVLSPVDASIPTDCWLFNPKLVMVKIKIYPLVNVYVTMERSTIFHG